MIYQCYRSHMLFRDQDPLSIYVQRVNGWFSVNRDSVDYYVPEDRAYMLYMYDSSIQRKSHKDYIV